MTGYKNDLIQFGIIDIYGTEEQEMEMKTEKSGLLYEIKTEIEMHKDFTLYGFLVHGIVLRSTIIYIHPDFIHSTKQFHN